MESPSGRGHVPGSGPPGAREPQGPAGVSRSTDWVGRVKQRLALLAAHRPIESRYVLEGELAHGAMGVVYRAWDQDLQRRAAMKVLAEEIDAGELGPEEARALDRFVTEAEVTGQLEHPGIVPVHEIGLDDRGRPYFTMRLVDGRTFEEILPLVRKEVRGWNRTRALRDVLLRVCEAVAYAHSRGVIHRDLKPANVMVGRFGETYVLDWGLARVLGDEEAEPPAGGDPARPAESDGVVGTPAYMSPEQSHGGWGPLADVYSIGAMLYQLLGGHPPYGDETYSTAMAFFERLERDPPTPLGRIDPDLPPELVAIAEKAMHRDLARRYPDVESLAEDLRAYLDGRVVRAYATGRVAELEKWRQRNPLVVLALEALLVVVLASLVGFSWLERRKNTLLAAEIRVKEAKSYAAALHAADASLRVYETSAAKHRLEDCPPSHRGWEWSHLVRRADASDLTLEGHTGSARHLAWAPDGTRLASGGADGEVRIWALRSRDEARVLEHESAVTALAWHPSGDFLAVATEAGDLFTWDPDGTRRLARWDHPGGELTALVFDAGGARLFASAVGGEVVVFDVPRDQGRLLLQVPVEVPIARLAGLQLSPDGKRLLTALTYGLVQEWDVASGELLLSVRTDDLGAILPLDLAYRPDGSGFAVAFSERVVHEWTLPAGTHAGTYTGHRGDVVALTYDGTGERLMTACADNTLRVWDTRTRETLFAHLGHENALTDIALSPDGARIATTSRDRTVRVWDARPRAVTTLTHSGDEQSWIPSLAPHPTQARVACVEWRPLSRSARIVVWDTNRSRAEVLLTDDAPFDGVAFDASGGRVLTTSAADGVLVLDAATGARLSARDAAGRALTTVLDLGSSRGIVAAATSGELLFWEDAGPPRVHPAHESAIHALALVPGRAQVVTASWDHSARLVDLESGEVLQRFEGHTGHVRSVDVSADGRTVLTASDDRTLRTWDLDTGRERHVFLGHEGRVTSGRFDPAAERVVSGSSDRTVRVWDARSAEALLTLRGHTGSVTAVAFTPDGGEVLSGGKDETLRVWRSR